MYLHACITLLGHFHDRGMVVGGAGAVWVEPGPDSKTVGDPHRVYTPDLRHSVHHTCGETPLNLIL